MRSLSRSPARPGADADATAMDDAPRTPPPRPAFDATAARSRYVHTPTAYKQRCPDVPSPYDATRTIATAADFVSLASSTNTAIVYKWLFRRFRHRKKVVVAPDMTVVRDASGATEFHTSPDRLRTFLRHVCVRRRLGVMSCGFYILGETEDEHWAHGVLCVWDGRSGDAVKTYFVDSSNSPKAKLLIKACRWGFREMVTQHVIEPGRKPASYEVRTYKLRTPYINSLDYTPYTQQRDRDLGLRRLVEPQIGMCAAWTLVFLLDVLCSKDLFLQRDHFARLFAHSGGTHSDERERDYARIMHLRHVQTWVVDQMFRKDDELYAETVARWDGAHPYVPEETTRIEWAVPGASEAFR